LDVFIMDLFGNPLAADQNPNLALPRFKVVKLLFLQGSGSDRPPLSLRTYAEIT
jgi:hypothetical protein